MALTDEQLAEAMAILTEIAEQHQPETRLVGDHGEHIEWYCRYCEGEFGDFKPWRHADDCLWLRAKALVEGA